MAGIGTRVGKVILSDPLRVSNGAGTWNLRPLYPFAKRIGVKPPKRVPPILTANRQKPPGFPWNN